MTTVRTRLTVAAVAGVLITAGLGVAATAASARTAAEAQGLPTCGNSSLAVTTTFGQGGAGHSWIALVYRNKSAQTCTVTGYPGVDAVTKGGHVLAHAKRTVSGYGGGGTLRTVKIRPGGYASASVEWLNFNGSTGGDCRYSAAIDTIVANTSRVHRLPFSVSVCQLQVHPTVAGTPQYPHFGPAQHYWIRGAQAVSANQNYYFGHARSELKYHNDYPEQVKELSQLISLPETGLTKKQIKEARADVKALDSFFATPGLYS
jgi:hypothetical protein